jgi:hypothetical protein
LVLFFNLLTNNNFKLNKEYKNFYNLIIKQKESLIELILIDVWIKKVNSNLMLDCDLNNQ